VRLSTGDSVGADAVSSSRRRLHVIRHARPHWSRLRDRVRVRRRGATGSERRYTDRQIYRRILQEARPYWLNIGAIFLLSLLATPLALLLPVPLKIAVDNVVGDKPLPGWLDALLPDSLHGTNGVLAFAVVMLVAVELFSQLQSISTEVLRTYTGERLTLHFRSQIFRHVQRLSISFHDRRGTADSNYRIQGDAASLQAIAVDGVIPFVASVFTLVAMVYVTARIDAVLAAIALVVAPAIGLVTWAYRRRLRQRHREVKRLESSALSVVQEVLTSLRVVKSFGQEAREERRFIGRAGEGMRARVRVAVIDGSFLLAIALVTTLGTAAVLYAGIRRVESGAITLGSLLLVMGYLTQLYGPLSTISRRVTSLQSAFASAERSFTLLDQEQDVPERAGAKPLGRAAGSVEFRNVSFAYDGGRQVLDRVSFSVEPGMRVGVAGRTGAGKTTLVSLLTRFYDPRTGVILLDGVDIRDYRLADLRDQFAIVLQEPVLFSTTIAENIAYGRPGATDPDIVTAAKAADVHDFIETLPEGYDTPVGERGMTLSGGERQRISLARAFLKDASILILDEPTSSVDLRTEATIIDAMERLMSGRTTFMIAHRLSTLENCELRLELEGGRLHEPAEPAEVTAPRRAGSGRRKPSKARSATKTAGRRADV
jgi:ATP-binding cassette subfamily B protein